MRPKSKLKLVILASLVCISLAIVFSGQVHAVACGPNVTPIVCSSADKYCRPCDPPALPDLELFAVQTLGVVWGLTGIAFFGLFIYNAYLYMFNKVEDAKKRMTQWIIGLLMILFAQPVVSTVMKLIVSDTTTCYAELRQPSFTFFFPNVCTDETTPSVSAPAPT